MRIRILGLLIGLFALGFGNPLTAQAGSDLDAISSALRSGNNRSALRKADKALIEVLGLRIKAQARMKKTTMALRTYEVLVQLKKSEYNPLLKEVAWAYLMQSLRSKDAKANQIAAEYLGKLGDKRAATDLISLLKRTKSFLTRRKVAEALGELGDKRAKSILRRQLRDSSFLVRTSAAWALGKIKDSKGVKFLRKCFRRKRGTSRLRCGYLLATLKKKEVRSFLRKELKNNRSPRAREVIAKGLSALGDTRWRRVVEKDLNSRLIETRSIAARVLGELKSMRSRRALQRRLRRERSLVVKIIIARSLGQLRSGKGVRALTKALKNAKSSVRADAAKALVDVGSNKSRSALMKALSDKSLLVRVYAAAALVELRRQDGISLMREAFKRGNTPLQALAACYAMDAANKSRSFSGRPVALVSGTIVSARYVRAFVESGGDGGDPDDGFRDDPPARRKASSGKANSRKNKNRSKPTARKKPKGNTSSGDGDDPDDDGW